MRVATGCRGVAAVECTMAQSEGESSRHFTLTGNLGALSVTILLAAVCGWLLFAAAENLFYGPQRIVTGDPAEIRFAGYMMALRVALLIVLGVQFFRVPTLDEPWQFLARTMLVLFDLMAVGVVIVAYAQIYRDYGLIDGSTGKADHTPVTALYFSIVTWTTVGYGDLKPAADIRLIAASEGFVGYAGMAIFIVAFWRIFNALTQHQPHLPRWLLHRSHRHRAQNLSKKPPEK
jgi:Ion channel